MRHILLSIPLLSLLLLGGLFWQGLHQGVAVSPYGVRIGSELPAFSLPAVHSDLQVDNAALPAQPFLLNVWASWCAGCLVEHSLLKSAAAAGVPLVGLNRDRHTEDAQTWLRRWGDPYRMHIFDPEGHLAIDLGVSGAPESFVIDGQQIIRAHHLGVLDTEDMDNLLSLLRALQQ